MNHSSGRSVIGIISRSGCAEERGLEARAADGCEERAGQTDLDESPAAVEVLLCVTTDPARTRVGLVACGWRLDAYRRAITPVSPPMHRAMPIVNSAPTPWAPGLCGWLAWAPTARWLPHLPPQRLPNQRQRRQSKEFGPRVRRNIIVAGRLASIQRVGRRNDTSRQQTVVVTHLPTLSSDGDKVATDSKLIQN
jgi:hypothetical protein